MSKIVELPEAKTEIEFPDDTTDEEIQSVIAQNFPELTAPRPALPNRGFEFGNAQTMREAAENLRALSPEARAEMSTPLVRLPEKAFVPTAVTLAKGLGVPGADTAEKIVSGATQPVQELVEGMASPLGIAMLPAAMGAPQLVGGIVALQAAPGVVEGVKEASAGWQEKDPEKLARGASTSALSAGLVLGGALPLAAGLKKGGPVSAEAAPVIAESPPLPVKARQIGLPEAAKALEEVSGKEKPSPPSAVEQVELRQELAESLGETPKATTNVPEAAIAELRQELGISSEQAVWAISNRASSSRDIVRELIGTRYKEAGVKSHEEAMQQAIDEGAMALEGIAEKYKNEIQASPEKPPPQPERQVKEPGLSEATSTPQSVTAAAPTPVEQYTANVQSVSKQKPVSPKAPPALGVTPFPRLNDALSRVATVAKDVVAEIRNVPKFTPFRESINDWNAKNQLASLNIRRFRAETKARVPDPKRREAIANWLQADGDTAKLQTWEAGTKHATRREGYRLAQTLTPEEVTVARSIRQLYDDLLKRAEAYGILDEGRDNYVTQIWKRPLLGSAEMAGFAAKLARTFKFGQRRTFENFFEGEQAGLKPVTKDIMELVSLYMSELEKTIATRELIRDLTTKTAADGNPLAIPEGTAKVLADAGGDSSGPMFVRPGNVTGDVRYAQVDHPALAKWKWASKDPESGRDVFLLGELRVHPSIARHLRNAIGRSAIRRWMQEPSESAAGNVLRAVARAGDTFSSVTKEVMLGTLSLFHHVQEGTHAVGHRVNPFFPEKMPIDAPQFKDALQHGLQVAGDRAAIEQFREGLGARDIFAKLGKAGELLQAHNDLLFNEYIPRLKWATYEKILARNTHVFQKELAAGKLTESDIKYLSANQANAAYGHLNYADLARNPTVQHVLRYVLLAPDFLEARSRFAGQAAQGLVSKVGREQLVAMSVLAGVFYTGARIFNKLINDDWELGEPFGVRAGNRIYRMRSVPEDIWRLFQDTRRFSYNRLNPVMGRGLVELLTGKNYRGEKVDAADTFKSILTAWVPIQMRHWPGFRNLTETEKHNTVGAWEQFLGSIGLQVSRYSPVNETYRRAAEWRKAQGEKEDTGTYPVSKYQQLRYALEDGDLIKAVEQLQLLRTEEKMSDRKIQDGFKESLFRPFSGSRAKEHAFRQSLDAHGKELYNAAEKQRERIWTEFGKAQMQLETERK